MSREGAGWKPRLSDLPCDPGLSHLSCTRCAAHGSTRKSLVELVLAHRVGSCALNADAPVMHQAEPAAEANHTDGNPH